MKSHTISFCSIAYFCFHEKRDFHGQIFNRFAQIALVLVAEHGDTVEVLEAADNGWVRLRLPETGLEGWMSASYLASIDI